jgi:hypothetical protein
MILKFAYLSVGGALIAAAFLAQRPTDPMLVPEISALQAAPSLTITFTVAKSPLRRTPGRYLFRNRTDSKSTLQQN